MNSCMSWSEFCSTRYIFWAQYAGNNIPSRGATSPKRSSVLNGRSSDFTPSKLTKSQRPGMSSGAAGNSYLATSRDDNSEHNNGKEL